ncbi:hypothetical protein QZH41_008986, partial [Actinostola sp. cb2023]
MSSSSGAFGGVSSCSTANTVMGQNTTSGRPISFPSFISTMNGTSTPSGLTTIASSLPSTVSFPPRNVNIAHSSLTVPTTLITPALPVPLQKPFIVGPGYSPIPHKVVMQICARKFVQLEDLPSENIATNEPEPELLFDGRLVLMNTAKKIKHKIRDIITWMEAFTIYMMIVCSYFPHRWSDLTKYKLLIVRTFRQFGGQGLSTPLLQWQTDIQYTSRPNCSPSSP